MSIGTIGREEILNIMEDEVKCAVMNMDTTA